MTAIQLLRTIIICVYIAFFGKKHLPHEAILSWGFFWNNNLIFCVFIYWCPASFILRTMHPNIYALSRAQMLQTFVYLAKLHNKMLRGGDWSLCKKRWTHFFMQQSHCMHQLFHILLVLYFMCFSASPIQRATMS